MRPKDEILNRYSELTGIPVASAVANRFLYPETDGTEFLLSVAPADFSASSIARAVEDCDYHLYNLNVVPPLLREPLRMLVAIRLNAPAPAERIARSVERYGYKIEAHTSSLPDVADDECRQRVAELLHILEI